MNENISRAAGAQHGQGVTEADFRALVEPLGRRLVQRSTLYTHLDRPARLEAALRVERHEAPSELGRTLIPVVSEAP
jgi:hypothetical protein